MFAGFPGTGVGALFFALLWLAMTLWRGGRACSWRVTAAALWVLAFVLVLPWALGREALGDAAAALLPLGPLLLLASVIALAALVARLAPRPAPAADKKTAENVAAK